MQWMRPQKLHIGHVDIPTESHRQKISDLEDSVLSKQQRILELEAKLIGLEKDITSKNLELESSQNVSNTLLTDNSDIQEAPEAHSGQESESIGRYRKKLLDLQKENRSLLGSNTLLNDARAKYEVLFHLPPLPKIFC